MSCSCSFSYSFSRCSLFSSPILKVDGPKRLYLFLAQFFGNPEPSSFSTRSSPSGEPNVPDNGRPSGALFPRSNSPCPLHDTIIYTPMPFPTRLPTLFIDSLYLPTVTAAFASLPSFSFLVQTPMAPTVALHQPLDNNPTHTPHRHDAGPTTSPAPIHLSSLTPVVSSKQYLCSATDWVLPNHLPLSLLLNHLTALPSPLLPPRTSPAPTPVPSPHSSLGSPDTPPLPVVPRSDRCPQQPTWLPLYQPYQKQQQEKKFDIIRTWSSTPRPTLALPTLLTSVPPHPHRISHLEFALLSSRPTSTLLPTSQSPTANLLRIDSLRFFPMPSFCPSSLCPLVLQLAPLTSADMLTGFSHDGLCTPIGI